MTTESDLPMTDQELREIQALAERATPGPITANFWVEQAGEAAWVEWNRPADRDFCNALDPQAVLRLIRRAQEADVRAAARSSAWLPIDTAPRDREFIYRADRNGIYVSSCYWREADEGGEGWWDAAMTEYAKPLAWIEMPFDE